MPIRNSFTFAFMKLIKRWIYIPVAVCIIIILFITASLLDIILAALHPRFYSSAAFIVIFGVAGVFAGIFCYAGSIALCPVKNEFSRWSIMVLMILTGLVFFFWLSVIEGGEYAPAFKSFGVTLAMSSLLFVKGKVEL